MGDYFEIPVGSRQDSQSGAMYECYEMDATGVDGELEANGMVRFYCSDKCKDTAMQAKQVPEPFKVVKVTPDTTIAIEDVVCDWCEGELPIDL